MTIQNKKEWAPRITLDEAISCSIQWVSRARQKNVISALPPTLYMAYMVDDSPFLGYMKDYSSLFKYSSKDDPENDRARDAALRLLSIALKAHFFLAKDCLCKHEPYFFTIPDISSPSNLHYGIIYKIESRPSRTIICATCDVGFVSTMKPEAFRFPVVLTKNSFKWYDKKHWAFLAQEADILDVLMKPWIVKKETDIADKWTNPADFPFGTILDVSYEIKDYVKLTGAKWSDGLKKWYLPKGFDVDPVIEFIKWIEHQYRDNKEELESKFWHINTTKKLAQKVKSN